MRLMRTSEVLVQALDRRLIAGFASAFLGVRGRLPRAWSSTRSTWVAALWCFAGRSFQCMSRTLEQTRGATVLTEWTSLGPGRDASSRHGRYRARELGGGCRPVMVPTQPFWHEALSGSVHPIAHVIDDDLGRSGSGSMERPGLERLVAQVCSGDVGAVYALRLRVWRAMAETDMI